MKKILVPVDFSAHTDITCNYAIEFAKATGAEILLFHTYFDQIILADSSFPDAIDMSTMYNEELLKEVFHQAERNMAELQAKMEKKTARDKINIKTSLAGGEIEPELRLICKDYKPDLVIIGSTGKGKTVNIWGKVSTFIIDHAKVPVLIIPESIKNKGFRNIMLATDLSEKDDLPVRKIFEIFENFNIRILCTHFLLKNNKEEEMAKMDLLRKKFEAEENQEKISFHMVHAGEDNQAAIDHFINENHIELIAFQPHKHGLFYLLFSKKITKKNLLATNIPLIAIPVQ